MGFGSRAFLAGSLGFAAAFTVACGGSNGLLSADQSSTLSSQLDSVSQAVAAGRCSAATRAATALNNEVADLPPSVTTKLVQNLGQAAATVSALASHDCSGSRTATTSTSSTPSTTQTVTTTSTNSNPTTTNSSPTQTNPGTGTATNPASSGTSSTSNGGAGLGGGQTGTSGQGGNGQ